MINKKIENGTHQSILSLLYKKTDNSAYIEIMNNFSLFIKTNNFTYITACYYFIDLYNDYKQNN
jgi:Tfp pilus assembly protein PilZ